MPKRSLAIFSYAFYLIFFFLSEQLRWEALGQKWFRENENKHPHDSFCWYDGNLVNKWSEQAGRFWICSAKVHKFWEGHKNMTKSPNFFLTLLSNFEKKIVKFCWPSHNIWPLCAEGNDRDWSPSLCFTIAMLLYFTTRNEVSFLDAWRTLLPATMRPPKIISSDK